MSDIDFDELDQAVNSLMGKAPIPKEKEDVAVPDTLSINPTLQPEEAPKYADLEKVAQKIGDETLGATQPTVSSPDVLKESDRVVQLEPKLPENAPLPVMPVQQVAAVAKQPSTGRFMDVVHPSSDMRAPAATVSNQAPQLIGPVPPRPAGSAAPAPVSTTVAPPPTAPVPNSAPVPAAASAPVATATPPSSPAPVLQQASPAELVASPFLTDAKVEKRPLGGEPPTGIPSSAVAEATPAAGESGPIDDFIEPLKDDQQQTINPEDFGTETLTAESQIQTIEAAYDKGTSNQVLRSVESGDTEKMMSDVSQLVEKPARHLPLAKSKSGWGVVVIILVVIVLSVAAAGAAYLLVVNKP